MTCMLTISLLTLGDPGQLTGGYLYHRRMAEVAGDHDAQLLFSSFPMYPFPLPALRASAVLRDAQASRAGVLVIDSIAAAYLAPWLAAHRLPLPLAASVHQGPGGIDHGRLRTPVQAHLDRAAYRRAGRLLVASDALAETLRAAGFPDRQVRVVAPGRDVAAAPEPVRSEDLREGRRAALLCVGNWVPRKGVLDLLEAVAALSPQTALPHLAVHEREGLILEPDDTKGLSRALERLATDEAYRHRLAAAAARRAQTFPTWAQTAERFFGELREVAGR